MSMEVTTYQLASSLIAKGMDWKQAIGTVLIGNLIVLIPMLLNAHAGAKYGIPFPVFIRAPFGVRGANLPAILRAIVACGWFGIQSWIGGTAIHSMLAVIWPAVASADGVLWACFLGFWLLNMVVVWRERRVDPAPAGVWSALHVCDGSSAADLGARQGGQFRIDAFDTEPVSYDRRISRGVFSVVDGDGGVLGHACLEYSGLHALLKVADVAGVGTGVRICPWR